MSERLPGIDRTHQHHGIICPDVITYCNRKHNQPIEPYHLFKLCMQENCLGACAYRMRGKQGTNESFQPQGKKKVQSPFLLLLTREENSRNTQCWALYGRHDWVSVTGVLGKENIVHLQRIFNLLREVWLY